MTKMYFKDTNAAIIVYDHTEIETFERLKDWVEELNEYEKGADVPILKFLVANKIDLQPDGDSVRF